MADLTRFDFHAKRFYFSEHVRVMSADEIGQYLLLLVESWMGGKDASLPDNAKLLARYARVENVSDAVLKMFPVVDTEHGPRRRNETLFEEWSKAIERSESARASVSKRTDRVLLTSETPNANERTTNVQRTYKQGTAVVLTHTNPSPSQTATGPVMPGPEATTATTIPQPSVVGLGVKVDSLRALPGPDLPVAEPTPKPDFKTFRITWRARIKKALGHNRTVEDAYIKACEKDGADCVLSMLDEWATTKTVEWAQGVSYPYGAFIKQLPKLAERAIIDAEEAAAAEKLNNDSDDEESIVEAIPAASPNEIANVENEIEKIAAEEALRRAERVKKFSGTGPVVVNEVDPSEYV